MHASKLTQLIIFFCCFLPFAACLTKREARVKIHNNTPYPISGVGLNHKYSDNYKEYKVWKSIPAGATTNDVLRVNYNTGAFTTGRDWWQISWRNDKDPIYRGSMLQKYSDPNNFRSFLDFLEKVGPGLIKIALKAAKYLEPELAPATAVAEVVSKALCEAMLNSEKTDGFKQHILRSEDENADTTIRINGDGTINFISKSGQSKTVYNTRWQSLGL